MKQLTYIRHVAVQMPIKAKSNVIGVEHELGEKVVPIRLDTQAPSALLPHEVHTLHCIVMSDDGR